MHLAIQANHPRVAQQLAIKGADVNAKTLEGQTAYDLACAKGFDSSLLTLLKPRRSPSSCPAMRPVLFVLLVGLRALLFALWLGPVLNWCFLGPGVLLYAGCLGISLVIVRKDPGFEPPSTLDLDEVYRDSIPIHTCAACGIKQAKGTEHCLQCKRCVRERRFHCEFTQKCVGLQNYKLFLLMLVIHQLECAYTAVTGALVYFKDVEIASSYSEELDVWEYKLLIVSGLASLSFFIWLWWCLQGLRHCLQPQDLLESVSSTPRPSPSRSALLV